MKAGPFMKNAVETNGLCVSFGKSKILNNVCIEIEEGMLVALLGPSGSGKTTLVKAIMGMNPISSGSITVFGKPVPSFQAVSDIGYMAQSDALYEDITAIDNLIFFGSLYGVKGKNAEKRASGLLDFTGLSEDRNKLIKKFSSGMKRRLSLAIALMNDPPLLILDEPTVGIDPLLRKRFREQFQRLKEQGCTIFMTTHVMDEAVNCDKVLLMRAGSIIAYGSAKELIEVSGTDNLENAFLYYIDLAEKEAI